MSTLANHTLLPAEVDEPSAIDRLREIAQASGTVSLASAAGTAALPDDLLELISTVLDALSQGQAVTVAPRQTTLSTQQAADLLGISRPTFVRLVESGEIDFSTPGKHRRVNLSDVLEYQERIRTQRREALEEMAADAAPRPPTADDDFIETR